MPAAGEELLRVVRIRKGSLKPSEFQLRPGEIGLSLFEYRGDPGPDRIVQAVRDAGKQGDLAMAVIPASVFRGMGLVIVASPGGTPDAGVNSLHREARVKWITRLWLLLRGRQIHDYFNDRFAARLCEAARLEE
jgi:hypothetical protein